jgi:hypothetical protein
MSHLLGHKPYVPAVPVVSVDSAQFNVQRSKFHVQRRAERIRHSRANGNPGFSGIWAGPVEPKPSPLLDWIPKLRKPS